MTYDIYCDGVRMGFNTAASAQQALADWLTRDSGGWHYSEIRAERERIIAQAVPGIGDSASITRSHYVYSASARV